MIVRGELDEAMLDQCEELGAALEVDDAVQHYLSQNPDAGSQP